jgi:cytochrome c-type biogenesis protein
MSAVPQSDPTLYIALFAGLLSFVSPCVLPLVPGYLSFISGVNVAQFRATEAPADLRRRVFLASLVFVLGLSTVFIAMGATATTLGATLGAHKRVLAIVGGLFIIVLGLHTVGLVRIKWLLYEKRMEVRDKPIGVVGAYVVGLAFALGWTPCIGPILGAILGLASQEESVWRGIALLTAYSLGLGVPFILSALAVNQFFSASSRLRRHMKTVEVVSGVLLIAVGVLLVSDRLTLLSAAFARMFPALQKIG